MIMVDDTNYKKYYQFDVLSETQMTLTMTVCINVLTDFSIAQEISLVV